MFAAYITIYGEHHPSTINSLINLAATHRDLHEYDLAAKFFEKAIVGRKATEGDNSVNYAMTLAMAAGCYRELDRCKEAEVNLKEAYMIIA